tara:strand:- start:12397 stop:12846 length:450 start_codon:yes stop_codon:yes gene_type:complete
MPSFNYGGTSLPSTQICGAVPIQNSLYNGTWGNNITGYTCTSIQNIHDSDVQKFYINPERGPITLKAGETANILIKNVWALAAANMCLWCEPCPCDADMMAPMTSGAGSGKTSVSGTRWGPGGAPNDQQGAWYSGNTQYTRLGVGGVNN